MTAEELWKASGLEGEYSAWSFGDDADRLAELVRTGVKKATCSLLCFYESEGEPLPHAGEYSVILDSREEAVCIIRTTNVSVTTFDQVSEKHAFLEGEGGPYPGLLEKSASGFLLGRTAISRKDFQQHGGTCLRGI